MFSFEVCLFNSHKLDKREAKEVPVSLFSHRPCIWNVCQWNGRASPRDILTFYVFTVHFSRTGWGRRERGAGGSYCRWRRFWY